MKLLISKYKDGNKYEPRKNSEGKYIINPNNPLDVKFLHELLGKRGAKAVNNKGNIVKGIAEAAAWVTPLGDAEDVINIYLDAKKGNYGSALLTAGLLFPSLLIPGNLNKGRKLIKKSKKAETTKTPVPVDLIQRYKDMKLEVDTHKTFDNPDINVIEDNVLREIAWIPNDKVLLSDNTFTTLLNAVRRIDEPLYLNALSKYLQDLRKSGDVKKLDEINKGILRVLTARRVVKDPNVRTFLGYFAIPEVAAESDNYDFLSPNTLGVTFPYTGGDANAYVRRPIEMLRNRSTTPLHENEHVYQWLMGKSTNWDNAYTPKQTELFNKVYQTLPEPKIKNSKLTIEKGTTNKELQRLILDAYTQEYGNVPSYWDLNRYIENVPEELLTTLFKNPVNGYHRDYLDYWETQAADPRFVSNWVRQFRNILKFGPALAAPLAINTVLPKEQNE